MPPQVQIPVAGIVALISAFFLGALVATKLSIRLGLPAILGVLLLGIMVNIPLFDSLLSEAMVEVLHISSLSLLLFYAGLSTNFFSLRGLLKFGVLLTVGAVILSTCLLSFLIWLVVLAVHNIIPSLPSIPISACFLMAACPAASTRHQLNHHNHAHPSPSEKDSPGNWPDRTGQDSRTIHDAHPCDNRLSQLALADANPGETKPGQSQGPLMRCSP